MADDEEEKRTSSPGNSEEDWKIFETLCISSNEVKVGRFNIFNT